MLHLSSLQDGNDYLQHSDRTISLSLCSCHFRPVAPVFEVSAAPFLLPKCVRASGREIQAPANCVTQDQAVLIEMITVKRTDCRRPTSPTHWMQLLRQIAAANSCESRPSEAEILCISPVSPPHGTARCSRHKHSRDFASLLSWDGSPGLQHLPVHPQCI